MKKMILYTALTAACFSGLTVAASNFIGSSDNHIAEKPVGTYILAEKPVGT
ncbi:hypothetical protein [Bacillus atrophaeus]|uniref:hypothetical protein n=1 Tax=Bacillus atrophaeus TaxID=1452 RepID=UPI00228302DB|nr:hypothetical protein [Bacillus atrophaeus]MCY8842483.1 hypothetical protein [Bacillus atrophaeus]MEC0804693.1 hypothetical protein [Bacillus atrophaeus]MEC0852610.1 hypothetical protein [Bacillus atrophaeus]MEC0859522.1 hypothetical protein [Bacillus atrophaeus]MEC0862329.1 hypothetical protein [Bacillus atrophaeus]